MVNCGASFQQLNQLLVATANRLHQSCSAKRLGGYCKRKRRGNGLCWGLVTMRAGQDSFWTIQLALPWGVTPESDPSRCNLAAAVLYIQKQNLPCHVDGQRGGFDFQSTPKTLSPIFQQFFQLPHAAQATSSFKHICNLHVPLSKQLSAALLNSHVSLQEVIIFGPLPTN